ncbi:hypothetical protein JCM10207_005418 [Rhodosporidiobolus poonsookiae]
MPSDDDNNQLDGFVPEQRPRASLKTWAEAGVALLEVLGQSGAVDTDPSARPHELDILIVTVHGRAAPAIQVEKPEDVVRDALRRHRNSQEKRHGGIFGDADSFTVSDDPLARPLSLPDHAFHVRVVAYDVHMSARPRSLTDLTGGNFLTHLNIKYQSAQLCTAPLSLYHCLTLLEAHFPPGPVHRSPRARGHALFEGLLVGILASLRTILNPAAAQALLLDEYSTGWHTFVMRHGLQHSESSKLRNLEHWWLEHRKALTHGTVVMVEKAWGEAPPTWTDMWLRQAFLRLSDMLRVRVNKHGHVQVPATEFRSLSHRQPGRQRRTAPRNVYEPGARWEV